VLPEKDILMNNDTRDNESSDTLDKRDKINNERERKVIDTIPPPPLKKPEEKIDKKQTEFVENEKHNLLFGVRRSIRYHNRRILFYDHLHKIALAVALLSSFATIISVLGKLSPSWITAFALIVVFFSAIDLIIAPDKAARMHGDLSKEFFNLEKSIIITKNITEEAVIDLQAKRLDIEMTEPPVKRVLDAICHNELCRAMGIKNCSVEIKWYQRILCQFFDFCDYTIKAG